MIDFAQTLKALLEQTNTKPEELGRELEIIPSTVSRWVDGSTQPVLGMQKLAISFLKKKIAIMEQEQWKVLWEKLSERVDSSKMPLAQFNAIVKAWHEVEKTIVGIRKPAMGPDGHAEYNLAWSYVDRDEQVILEVLKDGQYQWWSWNWRSEDSVNGEGTIAQFLQQMSEKLKTMKE